MTEAFISLSEWLGVTPETLGLILVVAIVVTIVKKITESVVKILLIAAVAVVIYFMVINANVSPDTLNFLHQAFTQ